MNREIKFRAWDKKNKKMRDMKWLLKAVSYEEDSWLDFIIQQGDHTYTRIWVDEEPNDYKHSDFEVMQFTGLTDKNGKEIYEGDIVSHKDQFGRIAIGKVVWKVPEFILDFGEQDMWSVEEEDTGIEVIGNIYKDSNLLKQTK